MKNITIVIQGPLSVTTLLNVYKYSDEYPMVIVYPQNDRNHTNSISHEIRTLSSKPNKDISIVEYNPKIPQDYNNHQNKYYQFFSTFVGLQLSKTEFSIKLRTDESYDLDFFSDKLLSILSAKEKIKVVCNDVFFRKHSYYKYHPTDHLLGGKTQDLTKIFEKSLSYCKTPELIRENKFFENLGKDFYRDMGNIVAEQYIGMSTLELFFDKTLSDIELMKSLFYIIPSKQLYPFKIVWNGDGKEFYDSKYFAHDLDVDDINFYDQ